MKRYLSIILCFVLTITFLSGCNQKPTDVRIVSVENSAATALAHIFEQSEGSNNYISTVVNLPNRVRTLMYDGECDVAVIPIETATVIYRRKNPEVKILAGISVGGFELVSTRTISDLSELKNQTIYLTERSTLMESLLKYAVSLYDIDPFEDISFEYASDKSQLKKMLDNNEATFALFSSADATALKSDLENIVTYNLTDELAKKLKNPSVISYCVVATNDFIDDNPKAVKKMLEDIENSIKSSSNTTNTVSLAKKHNLLTDDFYNEDFLVSCKAEYISGEKMKEKLTAYYSLLKKIKASSIGSSQPNDDFYFIP